MISTLKNSEKVCKMFANSKELKVHRKLSDIIFRAYYRANEFQ